jgi:tetratricopeptide (TPR) repeat protein/tRNA A-37 threonylcarbamoyl transferase component Bud32
VSELLPRLRSALESRYTIVREIGAGGMATVYLAEDVKHHRRVAVKVLRPELAATLGPARFLREIEIAAQLQHPHILPLLDSGEAEGFLYYVMPFIEGESLRDRLSQKGELPVPEAARLLRDVADALSYAHTRGVVHRDIKPDNVMLSGRHALVVDFGVAKAVSEATGRQTLTTLGVALGTPAYMAPEQAAADPHVDHRADIYALGALGYELLTGRPPFTGLTPQQVLAAQVTEIPKPVTEQRAACPPALAETIMRCLAKRPADRWQSAEEVVERLETLGTPSGGTTPTSTPPTAAVRVDDSWYGHPVRVAGLFTLAAVAILGLVYFLTIQLGLPDWVLRGAMVLLLLGLPIMIATGLVERRRAAARATGRPTVSGETGLRGWITWRRAIQGGLAGFSVLGAGATVYTAMRLLGIGPVGTLVASGKLSARDKLVVADFQTKAADSSLGSSVSEAFRIDLAQSPVIKVLGSSDVANTLQRMGKEPRQRLDPATAREVAVREGAKALVEGEINPVGKGFVLAARVVSAGDGAELVALRETADDDGQILKALDRLSRRLRERIGESLRTIRANAPLEKVTTNSLEALRLYSEGVRAHTIGDFDRAADLLRQAVAIDSTFAMAWRKLAASLGFVGSEADRVAAATKAFQYRERLPEIERHHAEAFYYWSVDVNVDKTVQAYRSILELDPNDYVALANLSGILEQRRQYPEAELLATRANEVNPGSNTGFSLDLRLGKRAKARASIEADAKANPESPGPRLLEALALASYGEFDSAQRSLLQTTATHRDLLSQWWVSGSLGTLALIRGRLDEADRYGRQYMAVSEQRKLPGAALAKAVELAQAQLRFRNDREGAVRTVEAGLQRHPLNSLSAYDRPYTDLAGFYALAGQPARAKALLTEYAAALPEGYRRGNPGRHAAAGYLALAEGRPQDAITEFRAQYDESGCSNCALFELGNAYELAHQPDSALAVYERAVTAPGEVTRIFQDSQTLPRATKRLGELYEEKGDREKSLDYYGRFVQLWREADQVLQPQVKEVKERMVRLAGEGGR